MMWRCSKIQTGDKEEEKGRTGEEELTEKGRHVTVPEVQAADVDQSRQT